MKRWSGLTGDSKLLIISRLRVTTLVEHNGFEVGMYCYDNQGLTGFGFCNLTEINGAACYTEEDFYKACENAAILGTFQASYTKDKYMPQSTINILERDALIGVGITGMCNNPKVLFNPEVQRKGAKIVKETNKRVAKLIGINEAARSTVVKPEIKESFPDVFKVIKSSQDLVNCLNKLNFLLLFS